MIFASFAFKSSASNSASAADVAKLLSIVQRVNIAPLRWMGCLSCGVHTRKKYPADLLRASLADKKGAS